MVLARASAHADLNGFRKIIGEQNKESQQRYNSRSSEMYRRPGDAVAGGEAAVKAARKFYALVSVDVAQWTGNSL